MINNNNTSFNKCDKIIKIIIIYNFNLYRIFMASAYKVNTMKMVAQENGQKNR